MTIQFGERHLSLSPSLAAQIGLEEAVLAQLVFELSQVCPVKSIDDKDWFYLAPERWPQLIPFWNMTKINQIFGNLEQLKIVERQFNENGQFLIRLVDNNAFHPAGQHQLSQPEYKAEPMEAQIPKPVATRHHPLNMNPARRRNQLHPDQPVFAMERIHQMNSGQRPPRKMQSDWQPDQKFLAMGLSSANVPPAFVMEQLPGFIAYYMEKDQSASDWNSRFIKWVQREWAGISRHAGYGNNSNPRQEQKDEVRKRLNDIHDTSW